MAIYKNFIILYLIVTVVVPSVVPFLADNLVQTANIYYLPHVRNNETQECTIDKIDKLPNKTNVILVIHGWNADRFHVSVRPLRIAYLAKGKGIILFADWRKAAGLGYVASRNLVPDVAQHLCKLLKDFLRKHQISYSDVQIIGHSLGAHIAGIIGSCFNNTIGRITGLDPAKPLFKKNEPKSLQAYQALFVDVIHTAVFDLVGDINPRGDVDFYPNGGHFVQRGCKDPVSGIELVTLLLSCSHLRAVELYAESVYSEFAFASWPCPFEDIEKQDVSQCMQDKDDEKIIFMGQGVSKTATGIYVLYTNSDIPYGLGWNPKETCCSSMVSG